MSRKMRTRICQVCGKSHEVFAPMPDGKFGVFCSPECKTINAQNIRGKACVICGTMFVAPSVKEYETRACCSRKCSGQHKSQRTHKPTCLTCGKKTKLSSSKYCSTDCSNSRHNKKLVRGAVAPEKIEAAFVSAKEGEWDKAVSRSMKVLNNKPGNRKDEDGWLKRINAGLSSLNTRRRREQREVS